MIRFILSLFTPFRWFIERMGVDFDQFILILKLKLTLDNRRPRGIGANKRNATKNMIIMQSIFQAATGLLFSSVVLMVNSVFTFYFMIHLFIMVMMALMIIMEFTTILFDTSENSVILPLPVSGNTISFARNAHVFVYLGMLAFNFSLAPLVISFFKFGFAEGILFFITIPFNVLFTLFFANFLYLGIMRIASGERLKNVLMYFQVVIVIFFMTAYQFGTQMVDKKALADMVVNVHWYSYFLPPILFSGFIEGLSTLSFDLSHLIFILSALLVPVLSVYVTGKYLTPVFARKLVDLDQGDRSVKIKKSSVKESVWLKLMAMIFTSKEDKASFKMMWKIVGRDRQFKQTVLPSIGYMVVIIAFQWFRKPISLDELATGYKFLFPLYFLAFVGASIASSLAIGSNKHIEWMFKSVPADSPALFFKGCYKAAFAKFIFPAFLVLSIAFCFVWPVRILVDIFIAIQAVYLVSMLIYFVQEPFYPFSQTKSAMQGSRNFFRIFLVMGLSVAVGFLHYFFARQDWLGGFPQLPLIVFYVLIALYVEKKKVNRMISWKKVNLANRMA